MKRQANVFWTAFQRWKSKDPFRESSIIAYNAIFSLPGLLVLITVFASYFASPEVIHQYLKTTFAKALGPDTAGQIIEMIEMARLKKVSFWGMILGVATILIGATGVFVQFQKSLNIIWEVKGSVAKSGIWAFIRARLFSFGLILSIAFLLLISLVVSTMLNAFGEWIKINWDVTVMWLFQILNIMVSLGIITLLFAMMFKFLPDARVPWKVVWRGAFVSAILFVMGEALLGFYFGTAEPGSGYGTAGSIILILLWTSYSSMIVFYGVEYTRAYADMLSVKVQSKDVAVKQKGRQV